MMYKLVARVVWSIKANRSTLAQARKICGGQYEVDRQRELLSAKWVRITVMIVLLGT